MKTFEEEHLYLRQVFHNKNPEDVVIAIDFDGTIAYHDYPGLGELAPFAKETILKLQAHKVRWILWTMRSGETLKEAETMLKWEGLKPWGLNKNEEQTWSSSPKCYAHLYIDDAAFGAPMVKDDWTGKACLDWKKVYLHLFGELPKGLG